jgi:hypothetical protein
MGEKEQLKKENKNQAINLMKKMKEVDRLKKQLELRNADLPFVFFLARLKL